MARAGFAHGFSIAPLDFGTTQDRARVAQNVRLFAAAVGFAPDGLRQVTQVHGGRVVDGATLADAAAREEADALVLHPGSAARAVGVRTADCVPILVGVRETGAVAAIHAGWRGVVARVVDEALARLGPGERVAAIGPCICASCFEVGVDVGRCIAEAARDEGVVRSVDRGKAWVDLRRAVRRQLEAAGVRDVEDVPGCTKHEPERFYSHRRDAERSGRHLSAIALR